MENTTINIEVVAQVAKALKDIKHKIVFVGGAVVSLYADEPAADEIRQTYDIDITLDIVSFSEHMEVEEQLQHLGFHPDPFGHAICSYKYKDIPVDIMSAEDGALGLSNRWYKIGFENIWTAQAKDQEIRILSAPCYLATKFEAFINRGKGDYRSSHDIEDIIYVLDNRINIVSEIEQDNPQIAAFLKAQFQTMYQSNALTEILMYHIYSSMHDERIPIVEEKILQMISK